MPRTPEQPLTDDSVADWLRRRRVYSAEAMELREILRDMPTEKQTLDDVLEWLRHSGADPRLQGAVKQAVKHHMNNMRHRI